MKSVITIAVAIIASSFLSSCKTIKGLGRDMQHLGAKIETKAEQKSTY